MIKEIEQFYGEFLRFLKRNKKKRVFVVPHKRADVDALCSAIIMQNFLLRQNISSSIYVEDMNSTAKKLLERFPYEINSTFLNGDIAIIVDTSTEEKIPEEVRNIKHKIVIDHHINNTINASLKCVIDTTSTTKIVYYLYKYAFHSLSKDLAPYVIAGILSDTGFLRYSDKDDLSIIYELCSLIKCDLKSYGFIYKSFEDVDRSLVIKALKRASYQTIRSYEVVITHIGSEESKVANMFIHLGFDVAVVINKKSKRLSIRLSDRLKHKSKELMEMLKEKDFSCGGHEGVIGCSYKKEEIKEEIKKALQSAINHA